MDLNQEMMYNDEHGFVSNSHPINELLSAKEKIIILAQFEAILQSVRYDHDNVAQGFHNLINVINSPN